MPKEISHWTLAARVREQLGRQSFFFSPVHRFPNLFFYGAVAPDTPYTYVRGPHNQFIQKQSHRLHGTDKSALVPVLDLLAHFPDTDASALAFAAGVVCHLTGDTVFHPLVAYYAGRTGRDENAVVRHHLFETAMDYYFWRHSDDMSRVSVGRIIRRLEIPKKRLVSFLKILFQIRRDPRSRCLAYALISHVVLQYLFRARWSVRFFNFLYRHGGPVPARNRALMYPFQHPVILPFFEKPGRLRHPADGRELQAGMEDLAGEAVSRSVRLLETIGEALSSGRDLSTVMAHPRLPEIAPDLPDNRVRYWSGKPDLESVLFHDVRCNRRHAGVKITSL